MTRRRLLKARKRPLLIMWQGGGAPIRGKVRGSGTSRLVSCARFGTRPALTLSVAERFQSGMRSWEQPRSSCILLVRLAFRLLRRQNALEILGTSD